MPPIRNNHLRARNAIMLIGFAMLTEVVDITAFYMEWLTIDPLEEPGKYKYAHPMRRILVNGTSFVINLLACIYFIQWFRRAYNNLHLTKEARMDYAEGWAAGSWFVPILNFIRPYRIMKEIWKKTIHILRKNNQHLKLTIPDNWEFLVATWWFFWIGAGILEYIGRPDIDGHNLRLLVPWTTIGIYSKMMRIGAGVMIIYIINLYMDLEQELYNWQKTISSD